MSDPNLPLGHLAQDGAAVRRQRLQRRFLEVEPLLKEGIYQLIRELPRDSADAATWLRIFRMLDS